MIVSVMGVIRVRIHIDRTRIPPARAIAGIAPQNQGLVTRVVSLLPHVIRHDTIRTPLSLLAIEDVNVGSGILTIVARSLDLENILDSVQQLLLLLLLLPLLQQSMLLLPMPSKAPPEAFYFFG